MSHQGASAPHHWVMKLWLEPGGFSPVPSSLRISLSIPSTLPISHLLRKRVDVTDDDQIRVLADPGLRRVDIEEPGAPNRPDGEAGRLAGFSFRVLLRVFVERRFTGHVFPFEGQPSPTVKRPRDHRRRLQLLVRLRS